MNQEVPRRISKLQKTFQKKKLIDVSHVVAPAAGTQEKIIIQTCTSCPGASPPLVEPGTPKLAKYLPWHPQVSHDFNISPRMILGSGPLRHHTRSLIRLTSRRCPRAQISAATPLLMPHECISTRAGIPKRVLTCVIQSRSRTQFCDSDYDSGQNCLL